MEELSEIWTEILLNKYNITQQVQGIPIHKTSDMVSIKPWLLYISSRRSENTLITPRITHFDHVDVFVWYFSCILKNMFFFCFN